jgi:hypothetical protein
MPSQDAADADKHRRSRRALVRLLRVLQKEGHRKKYKQLNPFLPRLLARAAQISASCERPRKSMDAPKIARIERIKIFFAPVRDRPLILHIFRPAYICEAQVLGPSRTPLARA